MKKQLKLFAVTIAVAVPANAHSGTYIAPSAAVISGSKITEGEQAKACLAEENQCPSIGKPALIKVGGVGG